MIYGFNLFELNKKKLFIFKYFARGRKVRGRGGWWVVSLNLSPLTHSLDDGGDI